MVSAKLEFSLINLYLAETFTQTSTNSIVSETMKFSCLLMMIHGVSLISVKMVTFKRSTWLKMAKTFPKLMSFLSFNHGYPTQLAKHRILMILEMIVMISTQKMIHGPFCIVMKQTNHCSTLTLIFVALMVASFTSWKSRQITVSNFTPRFVLSLPN